MELNYYRTVLKEESPPLGLSRNLTRLNVSPPPNLTNISFVYLLCEVKLVIPLNRTSPHNEELVQIRG